jgi:hypothetical protein
LTILLPLLLPSVVYFAYVSLAREGGDAGSAEAVPWFWLLAAGLGLTIVALVLLAALGGADPGSVYHPPREVNGHIEPGYFGPEEEKASP